MKKITAGRDVLGEFAPKFAQLNDDVLFGEVWSRESELSARDRSLITVTALMAQGLTDTSFGHHLQMAKENGITRSEIAEILTHAAFYAGWPKAWAAFRMAKDIWADEESADEKQRHQKSMVFPIGAPNDGFAQYFSGQSYLAPVSTEQVKIFNVTFEPGCRNNWQVTVGSYAKFSNDIKASVLTLKISSGASVSSTLISDALTLSVDSYAKFSGAVTVNSRQAKLTVSSGGSFNGTFSGNSLEAEVGSYGKINLKGSAQVASAAVRVSSGAVFSAPELRVADYDLTVSNYAKADVWCSGTLRINASTAARITYDGPCRVESLTDNIRRRK